MNAAYLAPTLRRTLLRRTKAQVMNAPRERMATHWPMDLSRAYSWKRPSSMTTTMGMARKHTTRALYLQMKEGGES
jgi:hypothetical protein